MGGIKHSRWYSMNPQAQPMGKVPVNPFENPKAAAEYAARSVQVHCKICGQAIELQSGDGVGMGTLGSSSSGELWKEEVEAGMHKNCFLNYMQIQAAKQNGNIPR